MTKKILYLLLLYITLSCSDKIDKIEIISNITNDGLIVKKATVIQESTYYTVLNDIENSVKSSKEAWANAPELNRLHRLSIIDEVSKKFLKKISNGDYSNEDKVIAYQFTKTSKSKKFTGYAVILFDEQKQHTLYYEIHPAPYNYYPRGGIKQLINKGLVIQINKLEAAYLKKKS